MGGNGKNERKKEKVAKNPRQHGPVAGCYSLTKTKTVATVVLFAHCPHHLVFCVESDFFFCCEFSFFFFFFGEISASKGFGSL